MKLLAYFDKYVELGLKPIPVYKDSKKPISHGWNESWSPERWRNCFLKDEYNMGILLGDIVDVEGDTEEANDLLVRMIDGVDCPRFRSSKSIHYLFKNPDPALTRRVFNGIEFRGHRHQSVVPPSIHNDGKLYCWLEGSKFPIPPMPTDLLNFYKICVAEKPTYIPKIKQKVKVRTDYTRTQCNTCLNKYYMNKKRLMLEVRAFQKMNQRWMCRSCRKVDIREICRQVRLDIRHQNQHSYKE